MLAAIVAVALVLRIPQFDQSLFGDELFASDEVAHRSLGGMLDAVLNGPEVTPPFFFAVGLARREARGAADLDPAAVTRRGRRARAADLRARRAAAASARGTGRRGRRRTRAVRGLLLDRGAPVRDAGAGRRGHDGVPAARARDEPGWLVGRLRSALARRGRDAPDGDLRARRASRVGRGRVPRPAAGPLRARRRRRGGRVRALAAAAAARRRREPARPIGPFTLDPADLARTLPRSPPRLSVHRAGGHPRHRGSWSRSSLRWPSPRCSACCCGARGRIARGAAAGHVRSRSRRADTELGCSPTTTSCSRPPRDARCRMSRC